MSHHASLPRSPSPARWVGVIRLGAVASVTSASLAVLAYTLTPLPAAVIVASLGVGTFAVSWHASAPRPRHVVTSLPRPSSRGWPLPRGRSIARHGQHVEV